MNYTEIIINSLRQDYQVRALISIRRLYQSEEGSTGGYGHIVFDDHNIEDRFIDFCLADCEGAEFDKIFSEETRRLSFKALTSFKELSENERQLILDIENGKIKNPFHSHPIWVNAHCL